MSYTIDCLRSHVPAALELLCDCVINPAFKPEELEEQKMRLQLLLSSPDVQLTILTEVSWYEISEDCMIESKERTFGAVSHLVPVRSCFAQ